MQGTRYFSQILMTLKFSQHIFEKHPHIKFHENPLSESQIVPGGRTDGQAGMMKLVVTFGNFTEATKKQYRLVPNRHSLTQCSNR
jgi:hypothetical protein